MRIVEPALLQRDDAQQMHCVEVLWRTRENLAIQCLCVLESPCLMMSDRTLQQRGRCTSIGRRYAGTRRHARRRARESCAREETNSKGPDSPASRSGARDNGGQFDGHPVDEILRITCVEECPLEVIREARFRVHVE